MDGVNEPDANEKILNLLDQTWKNKPLDEIRKTGQTSGTKMTLYSFIYKLLILILVIYNNVEEFFADSVPGPPCSNSDDEKS
ncbi:hypothetical protein Hanom_Chr11g00998891 [Helianthus anomalus]